MPGAGSVWVASLNGQESPGTRAPTKQEARALLCNEAPKPFSSVLWERHKKAGWKITLVTEERGVRREIVSR